MKINIFEGARRISFLAMAIWVIVISALEYDSTIPPVKSAYVVTWPDEPPKRIEADYCPSDASTRRFSGRTAKGSNYEVTLCFQDQRGTDGQILVPIYVNRATSQWIGSKLESADLSNYMSAYEKKFVLPKGDEEWADKQYWPSVWNKIKHAAQLIGGGLLSIWLFTAIVGWIVRGVAGIPSGMDKRPDA